MAGKRSKKKAPDPKTLLLLGIIVVLAAALAVSLWQLQQLQRPPATPQAGQPQQGQGGAAQKPQGQPGSQASLAQCRGDRVLVYVYASEEQRKAAKTAFQLLELILRNSGINTTGIGRCTVPASGVGEKLRAYPAVLYKGIHELDKYKTGEVDGFYTLGPHFSIGLAERIGVKPVLTYKAAALIVEGDAPLTQVDVDEARLRAFLVQFAAANITKVEKIKASEAPVKLSYYPSIILVSNDPLDKGLDYLKALGNGYYVPGDFAQKVIPRYLGARAVETVEPPPKELQGGPTVGGEAEAELYILEDYWCPFCARLYKDDGAQLESLVKEGTLRLHFVDLLIHPQVVKLHALANCLYNKTGDGWKYLQFTEKIYALLSQGKEPQLSDAETIAREIYGNATLQEAMACLDGEVNTVLQKSQALGKLGFSATPTLYFWNPKLKKGLIVRGYITPDQLDSIVEWVTQP